MNRSLLENAQVAITQVAIARAEELREQAAQIRSEAREQCLIAEHRRAEAQRLRVLRLEGKTVGPADTRQGGAPRE